MMTVLEAAARPGAAATLEPRAERLLSKLRQVRKDPSDEDAVHDARVAARRLLAAGELWAPLEPGWKDARDRLSKVIRRLGRVRNLDVTIRFLGRAFFGNAASRGELAEVLKRQRRKERRRLSEWMTGRRIRSLEGKLRWARRPGRNGQTGRLPAPADLDRYFDRLLEVTSKVNLRAGVEAGHEARRELRRLRYAHETLASAYEVGRFQSASKRFVRAQDLAGRWHDLCVLEELGRKAIRKGKGSGRLTPLVDRARSEANRQLPGFVREIQALAGLRSQLTGAGRP